MEEWSQVLCAKPRDTEGNRKTIWREKQRHQATWSGKEVPVPEDERIQTGWQ